MAKGGKRKGAGRPKGKSDKTIKEIREILNNYSEELLTKAVKMALDGNTSVMNKLLDKVLPSLNSIDFAGEQNKFPEIIVNVRSNTPST